MNTVFEPDEHAATQAETALPSERRLAYRSDLTEGEAVTAWIVDGSTRVKGTVQDLSLKGVAVLTDPADDAAFFVGENVVLHIDCDFDRKRSVEAPAVVRTRTEKDEVRRFGFEFANPTALRETLTAGLLRVFNERQAFRVEPKEEPPVPVRLAWEGGQTTGRLRDISSDGVGVMIEAEVERQLSRVTEVSVAFTLPGQTSSVSLRGSIRSRFARDSGRAVSIGVRFDPERSTGFASQQQAISAYVMTRQRELLQQRV